MRSVQYPAQTGFYTVKVKSEQSYDNWRQFGAARLQISVGQQYHESHKMLATLEWLKPRFSEIHICINDTLQRFNLMFEKGLSIELASMACEKAGREWYGRYENDISKLANSKIHYWNEWLSHPQYSEIYKSISNLYKSNDRFAQLVNQNINEIWNRRAINNPGLYTSARYAEFFELSKAYLLEEIAVFSLMYEHNSAIDIYPGTTIFAATVLQGTSLPGAPVGLGKGHFCRIDFTKRTNPAIGIAAAQYKPKLAS